MATPVTIRDIKNQNDSGYQKDEAMLFDITEAEAALSRGESDQDDDPEFDNALLVADMNASPLTLAAMADSGTKVWNVERAIPLFAATTGEMKNRGAITSEEKQSWDDLATTLLTHYDVFSFQAATLWRVLEIVYVKAKRNYDRLLTIPTHGFMDKNAGWISSVLRVANEHVHLPHSSAFPGEVGFVPQNTTESGRTTLRRLISQLMEVTLIAICEDCGEWVGFDKTGTPFSTCKTCRDANRKAEELAELNLKLAEKNELLQLLDDLLDELKQAEVAWVTNYVQRLKRSKAQVAFDVEFKHQINWLKTQVEGFRTTKVTSVDRADVEKLAGYIRAEIEKVHVFQHLTWCGCGAPTYAWKHPKSFKLMEAGLKCDECRRAEYQKAVVRTDASDVQGLAEAAQDAGVGLTLANGQVLAVAEEVSPAFDPDGRYYKAWERRKKGMEKEKGKGKKK